MLIAVIWVLRYGKKNPMKERSIRSIATRTPRNLFQQAEAHSAIEALKSLVFWVSEFGLLKNPKELDSHPFPVLNDHFDHLKGYTREICKLVSIQP